MFLTYKYRLKNNSTQRTLRRYALAVNQVCNYCNAVQKDIERRYREGAPKRKWPSHFDLQKMTKGTSNELGIHAQTVQGVCEQFSKSRDAARRSLQFRTSAGSKRSLGWIPFQKQSRQVTKNSITYLGKTFRFFGSKRRPLPETAKGGCFVEDARGRWWVCFHVEIEPKPLAVITKVGIDLGLKTLATLSDGTRIDSVQPLRKYATKLAIAQRAHNKKRVRAIHNKIVNVRKDYLHKASAKIIKKYGFIAVGDVSSSKLAKTLMAKSVIDAGWTIFRNMLSYKASRHSATFIRVDEKFTTQRCSCCQEIPDGSPKGRGALGIREWVCSLCGVSHDRDVNAAKNILALALSVQGPVEGSRSVIRTDKRISTENSVGYLDFLT